VTLAPPEVIQPKKPRPKTYISGHCSNGQCEGLKPKNFLGTFLPTCKLTSTQCAHACHKLYDEMQQIKIEMGKAAPDEPRDVVNISGYIAPPSRFVMPDRLALMAERAEQRAVSQRMDSSDVVTVAGHAFAPTPTGIRAPKQLEYMVLDTLKEWVDPKFEWLVPTPKLIAGVMEDKGLGIVSTGAIHAVFVRWVDMGFAKFQNRPAQFLGFTNEGTAEELDILKRNNSKRPWKKGGR
jgi:hypothetical protein